MVDLNPNQQAAAEDEVWGALQGRSIKTLGWTDPIPGAPKGTPGTMKPVGSFYEGTLKEPPTRRQARDYETGEPKFYKSDNNPIMDIVLVLDTAYRDPGDPDDDGTRRVILNGIGQRALQDEMRRLNVQRFGIGTYVKYTFTGLKPNQGGQPSKLVAFELRPTAYVPPEQRAVEQQLAGAGQPQTQYAPGGQPVQTYAAPPQQVQYQQPKQPQQAQPQQYGGPQPGYANSMQQGYQPQGQGAMPPAQAPQQAPVQPQQPVQQQPVAQPQQPAPVAAPAAATWTDDDLAKAVGQLEAANFDRQTAIAAVSAMPQFAGVTRQQVEESLPF